jgi:hypothetical protein
MIDHEASIEILSETAKTHPNYDIAIFAMTPNDLIEVADFYGINDIFSHCQKEMTTCAHPTLDDHIWQVDVRINVVEP